MYWYYKYPLLVLLALVLFGCGTLVWKRLPKQIRSNLSRGDIPGVFQSGDAEQSAPSPNRQEGDEPSVTSRGQQNGTRPDTTTADKRIDADSRRRLKAAGEQLNSGSLVAARTLAEKVISQSPAFSAPWRQAATIISTVNTQLINSDAPAPEKLSYIIKSGDSLARIAKKFNTTIEALQRGNDLPEGSARIYPGDVLRVYQGEWNIEVVKSNFVLILRDGGRLFKLYNVGVGRQNRTPVGTFLIDTKQKEPAWTPPGRHIPYGDPDNVLGTRWLGLKPTGETDRHLLGYGIHGTWTPETIGTAASEGCIRMRNENVNELFALVPHGTPVRIKDD